MHSSAPATSVPTTTTPARCGSNTPRPWPGWNDKHPLTCDNDKLDSWLTGWRRQPLIYQESLQFQRKHADHYPHWSLRWHGQSHRHRPGLVAITKYEPDP